MSTYTIVKSYKLYQGGDVSAEPAEELDGVQLRRWLKEHGYPYEEAERAIKQLDDHGSIRIRPSRNP